MVPYLTPQVKELVEPFRPYLVQPAHTFYLRCTDATLGDRSISAPTRSP
ncbi:hypothetical protein [Streptomyces sp. NPDC059010]